MSENFLLINFFKYGVRLFRSVGQKNSFDVISLLPTKLFIIVLNAWCASTVLFYFYRQELFSLVKNHLTVEQIGHYFLLPHQCVGIMLVFQF